MYDAGLYDSSEDEDGFSDFVDEMASMMANVRAQSSGEDSFEELQQMFEQMVNDNWFSTSSFEPSEPPAQQPVLSREQKRQPAWESFEFLDDVVDNEKWDDHSFPDFGFDIEEENVCSAIQNRQAAEAQRDADEYRRKKKPRLCDCDPFKQGIGMGLPIRFSRERTHIDPYPTFTFVA